MNFVDLLIVIVVVTILVTVAPGGVAYLAYSVRRARRPTAREPSEDGLRYFIRYSPGGETER